MNQQIIANNDMQCVLTEFQQVVYLDFDGEWTSYYGEILTVDNVEVSNSKLTIERIHKIIAELNDLLAANAAASEGLPGSCTVAAPKLNEIFARFFRQ